MSEYLERRSEAITRPMKQCNTCHRWVSGQPEPYATSNGHSAPEPCPNPDCFGGQLERVDMVSHIATLPVAKD